MTELSNANMSLKGIDCVGNHSCFGNRSLLTFIGLWPYHRTRKRFLRICLTNFTIVTSIGIQVYLLLTMELKMDLIIELMQTFLPTICFSLCYYNLLYNFVNIRTIFDRIRCDWNDLVDQQELIIMHKYDNETRLWSLSIAFIFYLYVCFLWLPSLLSILFYCLGETNDIRMVLPIKVEFFFVSKAHYFFAIWLEMSTMIIICTIGVVNYSIFISFAHHACALFSIVSIRIERPFKNQDYHLWYACPNDREKEYEWIIGAIRSHNDAINFVRLLKSVYVRIYFAEVFLALSFVIVDYLYLFELPPLTENVNEKCKRCVYIFASCLLIYSYCYFGQKLMNNSTGLLKQCCQIPFYALSVKTQKMLSLVMLVSLRACNFSIRGILVASHTNFAKTLRVSLSFAMVCFKVR